MCKFIEQSIILSSFISLWCMGLTAISQKGMLFYSVRERLSIWSSSEREFIVSHHEATLSSLRLGAIDQEVVGRIAYLVQQINEVKNRVTWKDYIAKPILLCPCCMASFHGLLYSIMFVVYSWSLGIAISPFGYFQYVSSIVIAAFFNYVLAKRFL